VPSFPARISTTFSPFLFSTIFLTHLLTYKFVKHSPYIHTAPPKDVPVKVSSFKTGTAHLPPPLDPSSARCLFFLQGLYLQVVRDIVNGNVPLPATARRRFPFPFIAALKRRLSPSAAAGPREASLLFVKNAVPEGRGDHLFDSPREGRSPLIALAARL